jgi:hypothetical protein
LHLIRPEGRSILTVRDVCVILLTPGRGSHRDGAFISSVHVTPLRR